MSNLTIENGTLVVQTKYDSGFVTMFKSSIPSTERKFDPIRKVWLVDPKHAPVIAQLIQTYLGEMVFVPQITKQAPITQTKTMQVKYVGQTKDRGESERSAFGLDNTNQWSVIFPESVLKEWFCDDTTPARPQTSATLYSLLGIKKQATLEDAKTSFRRLAKQWHPDVCKEPDAAEQFRKIKDAFDILGDPDKRARYDAGLALEESLGKSDYYSLPIPGSYRSPLRCGWILAEGTESIGRFTISKILMWDDITDQYGRTLVTSWPMGAKSPVEAWA